MIEIDRFEQHKFKPLLAYYGIKQAEIASSLNISQASLSNQLNGIVPMRENVELELAELIEHLRHKKKKYHKIIKRGEQMENSKSNVEDRNLSTFRRPKSVKKLSPKKAKKPIVKKMK